MLNIDRLDQKAIGKLQKFSRKQIFIGVASVIRQCKTQMCLRRDEKTNTIRTCFVAKPSSEKRHQNTIILAFEQQYFASCSR